MSGQYRNYGAVPPPSKAGEEISAHGIVACCNCVVAVPQDRYYSVEDFGQFRKMIGPGLSVLGCDCFGICIQLRSISNRVEQNECWVETKTKDNVFVLVKVAVQQRVSDDQAKSAIYTLRDVGAQIDSFVADVVRSHVPKMLLDEAFEQKDSISDAVMEALSSQMEKYGFVIHKALVTEVRPSIPVMEAMNEINKQKRLRDAAVMAGEAEKVKIVKAAEAAADAACLQGEGIARQRSAIVQGLRDSIQSGGGESERLSSERISELLLITQYFEAIRDIGANAKASAIFVPQSPGNALGDIANQIRNGVLQSAATREPEQQIMTGTTL
mmetsp:Transcript_156439/g.276341  ORF Transcript_156439/g.276341 Transcript_156439/m.276341 type:complete len:327 (-) Transcript_156439:75-1055(-)